MERDSTNATVTATFSRRMQLRSDDGLLVDARIKGKRLKPVCGDRVLAAPIDNETDWLITRIAARDNVLTRPTTRGDAEVLAANVELVVVVAAVTPLPDWFIVDRYICAAELMAAEPVIVFNKTELLDDTGIEIAETTEYQQIGLSVINTSAATGIGIAELFSMLANRRAILVGQSGVGKSSLINRLTGTTERKTAGISSKTLEGRHTTVNSVMIDLENGGQVIDSPGVRDYAPALDDISDIAKGFREFHALAANCRFANCRHLREPGCAVKAAVERQDASERRYESYKRLVNLTEQLTRGRR